MDTVSLYGMQDFSVSRLHQKTKDQKLSDLCE
jgi:hypothetical protein